MDQWPAVVGDDGVSGVVNCTGRAEDEENIAQPNGDYEDIHQASKHLPKHLSQRFPIVRLIQFLSYIPKQLAVITSHIGPLVHGLFCSNLFLSSLIISGCLYTLGIIPIPMLLRIALAIFL